ncbi:hypothetical protein RFI_30340 [Reticulomyxa filosa]|uniref:Uncharacterized protein n=1 Tax=Reticulomyxa filosa TaxID=46433 RepID=X6M0B9_RETFI|nr:hypothetical protein RFI_30340 [Reticulomyxa filosa]|eukprot:ETO07051.1 hypothetical protein RFI_30340 [Reticulomyxa filosa]
MLHNGLSLEYFKRWCDNSNNLCVLPGYCMTNTIGYKILSGVKDIDIDGKTYPLRMQTCNLSLSAHVDSKGILQFIQSVDCKHVMLVHGIWKQMKVLQNKIVQELNIPCHLPNTGGVITIPRKKTHSSSSSTHSPFMSVDMKRGDWNFCQSNSHAKQLFQCFRNNKNDSSLSPSLSSVPRHNVVFDLNCCVMKHFFESDACLNKLTFLTWIATTLERNLARDYKVTMCKEKSLVTVLCANSNDIVLHLSDHHSDQEIRMTFFASDADSASLIQSLLYHSCDSNQ